MDLKAYSSYGPTILRVILGLMFLLAGIGKLMNPAGTAGFFGTLGIPGASVMVWLVIAVEILGGLALLAGWQLRWAVWPIIAVMLVATALAVIPGAYAKASGALFPTIKDSSIWFHLLAIGALVTLAFTGPGKWAVPWGNE